MLVALYVLVYSDYGSKRNNKKKKNISKCFSLCNCIGAVEPMVMVAVSIDKRSMEYMFFRANSN